MYLVVSVFQRKMRVVSHVFLRQRKGSINLPNYHIPLLHFCYLLHLFQTLGSPFVLQTSLHPLFQQLSFLDYHLCYQLCSDTKRGKTDFHHKTIYPLTKLSREQSIESNNLSIWVIIWVVTQGQMLFVKNILCIAHCGPPFPSED